MNRIKLWLSFNWNFLISLILITIAVAYLLGMLSCTNDRLSNLSSPPTVKIMTVNEEILLRLSIEETDRFIYYAIKSLDSKNSDTMHMYSDSMNMSLYMCNKLFHKTYK